MSALANYRELLEVADIDVTEDPWAPVRLKYFTHCWSLHHPPSSIGEEAYRELRTYVEAIFCPYARCF